VVNCTDKTIREEEDSHSLAEIDEIARGSWLCGMLLLINRRGLQIDRYLHAFVRDDRLDSHIVGDRERVVARCAAKQRHGEQVRVAAGVSADDCKHM